MQNVKNHFHLRKHGKLQSSFKLNAYSNAKRFCITFRIRAFLIRGHERLSDRSISNPAIPMAIALSMNRNVACSSALSVAK